MFKYNTVNLRRNTYRIEYCFFTFQQDQIFKLIENDFNKLSLEI